MREGEGKVETKESYAAKEARSHNRSGVRAR